MTLNGIAAYLTAQVARRFALGHVRGPSNPSHPPGAAQANDPHGDCGKRILTL